MVAFSVWALGALLASIYNDPMVYCGFFFDDFEY
jgi:hypothetical protein